MRRNFVIIICAIFAVTAAYAGTGAASQSIIADRQISITNSTTLPVKVELSSLASGNNETLEIKPYSGNFKGVENEIMIYRVMYLTVAVIIMTALSLAAKRN